MKKLPILFGGYLFFICLLFFYSYTQVDLDLTFSRSPFIHSIVKSFQYIGYFQRPLSTYLFVTIVSALFFFYIFFLKVSEKLTARQVWLLLIITTVILIFSYNAFSYDFFNYIFDARIITFYHQNPYIHKALDFPHDPMLTFMRWTHRTYPYGPVWLILTVPLSFLGFQLFIPAFILFKLLMAGSFLGSVYFIYKTNHKIFKTKSLFPVIFFGFNPLVIIESLVSAHLDIVMVFFSLWALYLLVSNKFFRSLLILILSIGIKYATIFLVPVYAIVFFYQNTKRNLDYFYVFLASLVLMLVAIILESAYNNFASINFQPWYLLIALPFAAFLAKKYFIFIPAIIISYMSLLQYVLYLYRGDWNPPVPTILTWMLYSSIGLSIFITLCFAGYRKLFVKRD